MAIAEKDIVAALTFVIVPHVSRVVRRPVAMPVVIATDDLVG